MPRSLKPTQLSNQTQEIRSQCKIVVYSWKTDATGSSASDSELTKTEAIEVSSQVLSCNFTKTQGDPAGNFTFSLSNSPGYGSNDWKDLIRRGAWCLIYMSQDRDLLVADRVGPPNRQAKKSQEAKKLRCIGFIDRVSVRSEMTDRGAFDVVYEVSGRDFGVVYEDTSIWHNIFKYERIMLDALATSKLNINGSVTIDEAVSLIHDLFYNPKSVPGAKVNSEDSLVSTALQWLMPRQLLQDLGLRVDSNPFWGELDVKNFSETEANIAIEKPTDYLSGNAWDTLKKLAVPQLHELFTETSDDGKPQLIFRPIPWAINKRKYPTVGKKIQLYKDLPAIEMKAIDVIDFNLGEDNHARYNSFLVTVSTSLIGTEDNIALLKGSDFPKNLQDSIKRYGFRPMHVTVDSIVKNAEKSDGKTNAKLLREFNEVMYDYWVNAVYAESGEVNAIGRNDIKVGRALTFDQHTPYVYGKKYYIEGYTDTYVFDEHEGGVWTQTVMLTRGFEEDDLISRSGFESRKTPFNHAGEYTPANSSSNRRNRK